MQLERLERQILAEQQVAAVFLAAGAKDIDLPSLAVEVDRFDAALTAKPLPESSSAALLRELRVG